MAKPAAAAPAASPVVAKPGDAAPAPVLVCGVPSGGRMPIGARFAAAEAGIARWIARQRGLGVLAVRSDAVRAVAPLVPEWCRGGPDGVPRLPVLTAAVWERLRALPTPAEEAPGDGNHVVGGTAEPAAAADAAPRRLALAEPLWSAITVGDVVLAAERGADGADEGWWEAVVLAIGPGDECTLAFRDYPEEGLIRRPRRDLALLHPKRG